MSHNSTEPKQPSCSAESQQQSQEPGTSRGTPLILSAPDLQLDCLESDDDDDDDDDDDGDGGGGGHRTAQGESLIYIGAPYEDSVSSDTATTASTDSEGPSSSSSTARAFRPQRFRSASTSDSVPLPKFRRLTNHRDPFGYQPYSNVLSSSNNLYMPHALLLRRQQLQRELQRRFNVDEGSAEVELPLSYRHQRLYGHSNRSGINSQFNRLLQLVGMRGLNMGLRPEVIEEHSTKSQYVVMDVAAAEKEEDREMCTICLANYEQGIEIRTLNCCKHCFHTDCVDRWLKSNNQCPLCRLHVAKSIVPPSTTSSSAVTDYDNHPPTPPPPAAPNQPSPS